MGKIVKTLDKHNTTEIINHDALTHFFCLEPFKLAIILPFGEVVNSTCMTQILSQEGNKSSSVFNTIQQMFHSANDQKIYTLATIRRIYLNYKHINLNRKKAFVLVKSPQSHDAFHCN